MSRKYQSNKSGLVIATGEIKSISDDKLHAQIEVRSWDIKEKQYVNELVSVKAPEPITEQVGDIVTIQGWNLRGEVLAEVFTKDAVYAEVPPTAGVKAKAVVAGDVMFASYSDEIDKETGEPRLNKAGKPKKPHFDIGVLVGRGEQGVMHIVSVYDFPERAKEDGTVIPAQKNIERYQKLFSSFDKTENPMYVAIITQPGNAWVRESHDKQNPERVYQNHMCSHLGADSIDVTFLRDRVKENTKAETKTEPTATVTVPTSAPQPTAPTTAPIPTAEAVKSEEKKEEAVAENSGFDAGDFALDDFDTEFIM